MQVEDELGNDLVGKLSMTVDVVTPDDHVRELVRTTIRSKNELGSRLARGIRICRIKQGSFVMSLILGLTIDLVCRHVDEALNLTRLTTSLEESVCSEDVVAGKLERILEGPIDMGLSGKVDDEINLILLQNELDQVERTEIPLDKLETRILPDRLIDVLWSRVVVSSVEDD
jgi:hypothetical protein